MNASAISSVARPDARGAEEIERIYASQQKQRAVVSATTAVQRIEKLRRLERSMFTHRDEILAAMWADFRKPAAEVDLSEIYPVVSEARHAIRHLRRWMRPTRVTTRLALLGSSSHIRYEAKGVVLILAPWNFPFNLTLGPLVSAIAAGNCAILKPSEMTPASAACMKRLLGEIFDESEVAVIEGDASTAQALLARKFDHIFFTGSPAVGRVVMKAAAEHLTSVTLELGGKSPVLIDSSANLDDAAKKIAWGKAFNSGQVCIAPDYVLVDETVREPFLEKLTQAFGSLGGEASRGILVNERHAQRVHRLLDAAKEAGATVVTGGTGSGRELGPTVLTNVPPDAAVMQDEIFGPLLPVLSYRTLDEAFALIEEREKPLVLYVFSRARANVERILARTRAGGTAINHTMIHFYETDLPFGGVGPSGMGRSHGFAGFEAFSNARGVLRQWAPFSAIELLFPPYGGKLQKWLIDFTVRWL
jgi:aldehyde dehydrogenase (NAD+)